MPSENLKETLILFISPLLLAAIFISPELIFFETFRNAGLADLYYHKSLEKFAYHCQDIFAILFRFELLPAMLVIKGIRISFGYAIRKNKAVLNEQTRRLKAMSVFMLLFFSVFALLTARMPFLFTRDFIVLHPILILILLTDVLIILEYAALVPLIKNVSFRLPVLVIILFVCMSNVAINDNHILDYIYQVSHPYRGPLDYYIPAIKERFPHPKNIVLATNYEEMSYEYYLGCKVILGYQNHFQSFDDSLRQYSPDVIIIRPGWSQDSEPYRYYLQHATYQKISFPIRDWQVNNVPDLYFFLKHQFKTNTTDVESEMACMYIKIKS